ncbi:MAG: hypothetical protein AVDCRST_MAG79-720, partial [uncultured Thermoleophilia bacterium]
GCPFRTRCPRARERCAEQMPPLDPHAPGHLAACWYPVVPAASDRGVGVGGGHGGATASGEVRA